jgi:BirA family transcriptional regulator, biotin operon repressor / biotin---[acetyl-CoA-carboxylase] ligase
VTTAFQSDARVRELQGTIFFPASKLHWLPSVGSTNAVALDAALAGAPEGTVFCADEQTAGRGRGGHAWHSPRGSGIYLSAVLRPRFPANEILWLSLMAGLAVHAAMQAVTHILVDLRWPNDIMFAEKKLGGILTEISTEGDRIRHAVVGIGLNINQDEFPRELRAAATSLRAETGREWPREAITIALLKFLHQEYQSLLQTGSAVETMVQRFEECSSYARGRRVAVDDHGAAEFEGITAGLDRRGFLQVETATGMRTVISGGVRKI